MKTTTILLSLLAGTFLASSAHAGRVKAKVKSTNVIALKQKSADSQLSKNAAAQNKVRAVKFKTTSMDVHRTKKEGQSMTYRDGEVRLMATKKLFGIPFKRTKIRKPTRAMTALKKEQKYLQDAKGYLEAANKSTTRKEKAKNVKEYNRSMKSAKYIREHDVAATTMELELAEKDAITQLPISEQAKIK